MNLLEELKQEVEEAKRFVIQARKDAAAHVAGAEQILKDRVERLERHQARATDAVVTPLPVTVASTYMGTTPDVGKEETT